MSSFLHGLSSEGNKMANVSEKKAIELTKSVNRFDNMKMGSNNSSTGYIRSFTGGDDKFKLGGSNFQNEVEINDTKTIKRQVFMKKQNAYDSKERKKRINLIDDPEYGTTDSTNINREQDPNEIALRQYFYNYTTSSNLFFN